MTLCTGNVAVVGNGPISEKDRCEINRDYDCVVRFNDMKNYKLGDVTTVHAIRPLAAVYPGITKSDVPVWPVIFNKTQLPVTERTVLDPIIVHERSNGTRNVIKDGILFPGCNACNKKKCSHSLAKHGPSTGAAVIDELNRARNVESIHVYGMNWNGGSHHVDFKHSDLISRCCDKCVLHPTCSDEYDNRSFVDKIQSGLFIFKNCVKDMSRGKFHYAWISSKRTIEFYLNYCHFIILFVLLIVLCKCSKKPK